MFDNKVFIDRVKLFAKKVCGSVSSFERRTGLSDNYIKSVYQKNSAIGVDKLAQIYAVFPQLNLIWLLTGNGDMEIIIDDKKDDVIILKREAKTILHIYLGVCPHKCFFVGQHRVEM